MTPGFEIVIGTAVLTAAVTAAFTHGIGYWVWLLQEKKKDEAAAAKARAMAYVEVCNAAYSFINTCQHVAIVGAARSGAVERLRALLRMVPPFDQEKYTGEIRVSFGELLATWTRLGAYAKQDGSDLADKLVTAASAAQAALRIPPERGLGRLVGVGVFATPETLAEFDEILKQIARHRIELLKLARKELSVGDEIIFPIDENRPVDQPEIQA